MPETSIHRMFSLTFNLWIRASLLPAFTNTTYSCCGASTDTPSMISAMTRPTPCRCPSRASIPIRIFSPLLSPPPSQLDNSTGPVYDRCAVPAPLKKMALRALARVGHRLGRRSDRPCRPDTFRKILIFQAGGIGDILRAFPLILALKGRFPEARLYTLTPFHDSVFRLFPAPEAIARSFCYNPAGAHRGLRAKWRLAQELQTYRFDLIVNPGRGEGMLENAILAFFIGAPCRIGFEKDGAGFPNTIKRPLLEDRPILVQNMELLRPIGVDSFPPLSIRIPEEGLRGASLLVPERTEGERLIAIHAGSHWSHHLQWPLDRYVELTRRLLQESPHRIFLLGSPAEARLTGRIAEETDDRRVIDLAGKTGLGEVAGVLARMDLFIGNDSGLLHVALALKIPAVGIFGWTSPRQVIAPEGPCVALHKGTGPLYLHQPFFELANSGRVNPIDRIEVQEVLDAAQSLLR